MNPLHTGKVMAMAERLVSALERWVANQEAAERRLRACMDGKQLRALTDFERLFMTRKEGEE